MRDPDSPLSGRGTSVQADWRARLPEEKLKVFTAYVRRLESTYGMLSVSLNEALALRHEGRLIMCCQAVNMTPSLCATADRVVGSVNSSAERARQTLWHGTECRASGPTKLSNHKRAAVGTHERTTEQSIAVAAHSIPA